jgi:hypothetical protein
MRAFLLFGTGIAPLAHEQLGASLWAVLGFVVLVSWIASRTAHAVTPAGRYKRPPEFKWLAESERHYQGPERRRDTPWRARTSLRRSAR